MVFGVEPFVVFDVESLSREEVVATQVILETIKCTHPKLACVDCPCFEICTFVREVSNKCKDVLKEVLL